MTILKELYKLSYQIQDKLPTIGYGTVKVHWAIVLDKYTQKIARVVKLETETSGKKKAFKLLNAPDVRRNNIKPKLITDTAEYVLGNGKKAEAYKELLQIAYKRTGNKNIALVLKILTSDLSTESDLTSIKKIETITFSIDGEPGYIHDLADIKTFWGEYTEDDLSYLSNTGQCLITGEENTSITGKGTTQFKTIPGVNSSGGSLVSAYRESFHSWNLEMGYVSPISIDAERKYSQSLQYLLNNKEHRITIGNITYLFWSDSNSITSNFYEQPDAQDVKDCLSQIFNNFPTHSKAIDRINILGLSGNGGRIIVREWINQTEFDFIKSYNQWLKSQEIFSINRGHLGIWKLAASIYRTSEDIQNSSVIALIENAVTGAPLPINLIQKVLTRNRIDKKITYSRMVLLHMYLTGLKQDVKCMQAEEKIAFCYGNLLAVYAKLQRSAQKIELAKTNAVKLYPTAGITPIAFSHKLGVGATHHLSCLPIGLQIWYTQRLALLNAEIATEKEHLPKSFGISSQAYFDLGFWSELNTKHEKDSSSPSDVEADPSENLTTEEE